MFIGTFLVKLAKTSLFLKRKSKPWEKEILNVFGKQVELIWKVGNKVELDKEFVVLISSKTCI